MKEKKVHSFDRMLLNDIAHGNEDSFSRLVHEVHRKMYLIAVSLVKSEAEADDILQEVFLKVWLHRRELPSLDNPFGWIYTILARTVSNHLRAKLRRELHLNRIKPAATTVLLEEDLDARFTSSLIDKAASLLPEKRKEVFLLNKKEGLNRKEIARQLNLSENTVRNQLAEAIQFIRKYVNYKGDLTLPVILILLYIF